MADQDYPSLYAALESSAERAADAAVAFEATLGGTETQMVPVNGFPDQPTLAGRVKEKMDAITVSLDQTAAATAAEVAYSLAEPRTLADEMPWAIVDQFYRAILGVKANGAVHAVLDQLPGLDLVGDYAWAITDTNGVVLLGIKWSGEVVTFGQTNIDVSAYADGPIGAQDIWALVGGVPYQVTSSGDNFSPLVASGQLSYIERKGAVTQRKVDLPIAGSIAPFVTRLLHIVGSGQSLSMGSGSVVTTTQPPTANRLLTIQDGVRLTSETGTLTSGMVAPFKPLVAKTTEIPVVQLSAQLNRIRALPSDAGLLTSCHGRGGQTIAQLSKGSVCYSNSIVAVTAAKAEADRLGLGYSVPFVDWIQGEYDWTMPSGAYVTALLQLQSDYDADIRAASGQTKAVPILLDQISNWSAYGGTDSYVPLDQLKAALDYPQKFICAGPKYWVPTNADGVHLPADSTMRVGAMHARAAQAIINGASWKPTHAVSAKRSGNVVMLKFHLPVAPLVIDTALVTDPGNLGLRYSDTGSTASIQSVRQVSSDTLEITLTAVPTGTSPYIGIADRAVAGAAGGPTTGARACLRDSSPDFDGYGKPLYNWACHQRIDVQEL